MKRPSLWLLVMALCACGAGTTQKAKPKSAPQKLVKAPPPDDPAFDVGKPATIAVSPTFVCAIRKDTGVACWGDNRAGQLGQGDDRIRRGVQLVAGLKSVVEVAAGARHACARKDDGEVWCWGDGAGFRLGTKLDAQPYRARKVPEVRQAVALAAGDDHSCAVLIDGSVRCWGSAEAGKLGLDHLDHVTEPANVALAVQRASGVALTATSTCVRDGAGQVHCWGQGDNLDANQRMTMDALKGITTLYTNHYQTCARDQAGAVKCWQQTAMVEPLARVDTSVSEVALLKDEVCSLSHKGVHCWRDSEYGDPDPEDASERVAVDRIVELRAAGAVKCARDKAGKVLCWGSNADGQLGQSPGGLYPTPVEVSLPGGLRKVYVADNDTCAIGTDGRFRCWGAASGKDEIFVLQPLPARALTSVSSAAVGAHRCVVTKGKVACWGMDDYGQLGVVTQPKANKRDDDAEGLDPDGAGGPDAEDVEDEGFDDEDIDDEDIEEEVIMGDDGDVARKGEEGSVDKLTVDRQVARQAGILSLLSTHSDAMGLGGFSLNRAEPVIGLSTVTDVAVSHGATCVLTADGLRCWGNIGKPGGGRHKPPSMGGMGGPCGIFGGGQQQACDAYRKPRPIVGVDRVKALVAYRNGFCVLRPDARAQCLAKGAAGGLSGKVWGRDLSRIFGGHERVCALDVRGKLFCNRKYHYDADEDPFDTPLRAWAGGRDFECAVTPKGRVLCVGDGAEGQLGDGRAQDAKTPVEVAGITNAMAVYAGSTHACARLSTGALHCWGSGDAQMGRPKKSMKSSTKPVVVAIEK